jgi:multiple sugar transport system ATP-binding protein
MVVEPTGSETQVFARLGGETLVVLFRERMTIRPGDTLPLTPVPDLIRLFDADSGQRIR